MSLARLLRIAQHRGLVEDETADDWDDLVLRVRDAIRSQLFEEQLALFDDVRTWTAASCGRQAGKNFTAVRLLLETATSRPNGQCFYLNQTYAEARRIMWADELDGVPAVAQSLGIPFVSNETRMELKFPNGSTVTLLGADRGGWEKLRGSKLDLLVVDEVQKADDVGLRNAIEQVLPACFVARRGRFVAIGTPDEFCVGTFHDICTAQVYPQFGVHHWDASDNDRRPDVWEGLLTWKAEARMEDDDPRWLREGKGLWVRSDERLMLALSDASLWDGDYPALIPSLDGTPVQRRMPLDHYAGLDFGFTDSAALVVASYSREEGVLREVHSWKSPALDTDALAEVVKDAVERHRVKRIFADAADPKTIADLSRKWRLPVVAIEKLNKVTWIQDMRAKARLGRLQVMRGSVLHRELELLVPDPEKLKLKKFEAKPGCEDHAWDALRYVYRGVLGEMVRPPQGAMTEMQRREAEVERWKDRRIRQNQQARKQGTR